MKRRTVIILAVLVLVVLGVSKIPGRRMSQEFLFKNIQTEAGELGAGDNLFDQMRFAEAIAVYENGLEEGAGYEALWRLARAYNKWGIIEKERRSSYVPFAIRYARQAVGIDEDRFEGHLYLAESLGTSLKYESIKNKLKIIDEIKDEAERAIELNPEHYRAYLVLGMWHSTVAGANWMHKKFARLFLGGLPDASYEEAIKNLQKSTELKGDFLKTHYELALIYHKLGDDSLAVSELEAAISCPITNKKERNTKAKSVSLLNKIRRITDEELSSSTCVIDVGHSPDLT